MIKIANKMFENSMEMMMTSLPEISELNEYINKDLFIVIP
jgi:hypothetical protein